MRTTETIARDHQATHAGRVAPGTRGARRRDNASVKPPGCAFARLVTGIADEYPAMLIPLMRFK